MQLLTSTYFLFFFPFSQSFFFFRSFVSDKELCDLELLHTKLLMKITFISCKYVNGTLSDSYQGENVISSSMYVVNLLQ